MTDRSRHPNQRPLASLPPELRRTTVPAPVQAWIAGALGSEVVNARRLPGASSTAVHLLALAGGRHVVLRRYVWPGLLDAEPDAPTREVDALQFARAAGLPTPELLAADTAGAAIGDGVPTVVMARLGGRAVAVPDLGRLAEVCTMVHSVEPVRFPRTYFPWYADTTTAPPLLARRRILWEAALTVWHTEMPDYRPCFIHRDFHPGNILWVRGRCSAIVDWSNACRGPAGCDIALCREKLMWLGGDNAADSFQAEYERITATSHHPYWEIASALDHGPSGWTHQRIVRAETRLERALGQLGRIPKRRR